MDIETVSTYTRQNTGRVLVDSGDAYGRHYDQPVPSDGYNVDSDGYVSISLTHMLAHAAQSVAGVQRLIEDALDADERLTWFESGPRVMEELGYVQAARDNTCNNENDLDQHFVWEVWQREGSDRDWVWDEQAIVLVYVHTGCDVRWGYSRPLAVRFTHRLESVVPLDMTMCFSPTDEEDDAYEQDHNQSRLRDDYPTFIKHEDGVLTLADGQGNERSFTYWARELL